VLVLRLNIKTVIYKIFSRMRRIKIIYNLFLN
jgi:hypothetical protein